MAIDDPLEKIRELAKDGEFDGVGAALQGGGLASPLFKVMSIVYGIGNSKNNKEKVLIAINALCDELQRTQDRWPRDLESALDSDWFKRVMRVLMEESTRSVNEDYARLLARAAGQGCFPSEENKHRQEDLASLIHDLARLGQDDIQMLKLLGHAYNDVFKNDPQLSDANRYTNYNSGFKHKADELNIHPDDRLSLGARLQGFGLAFESVPQQGEHYFRLTRRGIYLLSLLEAAELPLAKQN